MLFQYFGVGQCQASWNVRQNTKIVDIFRTFWQDDDLIVSFDGLSFSIPHEISKRGYFRNKHKLHCDQSFVRKNEFECIQSWATAYDVREGDSTLVFLEKSHLLHKEFQSNFKTTEKKDWYKLTKEEISFYTNRECNLYDIQCPAGSIVFWDSRTIHAGREALKNRVLPNYRCVIYLCYMPRSLSNEKNNKKRRVAFENKRTCSHNASNHRVFSKKPQTYGKPLLEITEIEEPVLNETGLSLL